MDVFAIIVPALGLGLIALGAILWTSSEQLKRVLPRAKAELSQVPIKSGRLMPRAEKAGSGLLRTGPVMAKDGRVMTACVLSDDALRIKR